MTHEPMGGDAPELVELHPAAAERLPGTEVLPRTARARWRIALGVTTGALALAVAGAVILSGRPDPEAMRYVPSGSAVVVELRPDLPGDQRGHLGNLLAHFPGFKDQSILDQKLDETYERLVRAATGGSVDYRTAVKPYVAGPAFLALRHVAAVGGATAPDGALVLTTDGTVTCGSILSADGPTSSEYRSRTLLVAHPSAGTATTCALDGRYLLLGDEAGVKAAIDAALDGSGLTTDSAYMAARTALGGDRLASVYVALRATVKAVAAASPGPLASVDVTALPEWAVATLRVRDDGLLVEGIMPTPDMAALAAAAGASPLPTPGAPRTSTIASAIPADTVLLVETHDAGTMLGGLLRTLESSAARGGTSAELGSALSMLGGAESLVGWVRDAGLVVRKSGTSYSGGLVLTAADADAAAGADVQLRNLVALAGASASVTTRTEQDGATTITIVEIKDPSALLGGLTGGGTGSDAVSVFGSPWTGNVEIAFAARDARLVVGSDAAFVRAVLDAHADTSIASTTGFRHAIGIAGTSGHGLAYVDIAGLADAMPALFGLDATTWAQDYAPYVAPLEAAATVGIISDGRMTGRFVITVK